MPRDIVLGVHVQADAGPIYEAITTREGLSSFWTPDVVAEPAVGSEARFGFHEAPMPIRMRVDRLDPPAEVEWTCVGDFPYWTDTRVTWSMSPADEGGTHVLFRHTGFSDKQPIWEVGTVTHTWSTILDHLKELAETGATTPALR